MTGKKRAPAKKAAKRPAAKRPTKKAAKKAAPRKAAPKKAAAKKPAKASKRAAPRKSAANKKRAPEWTNVVDVASLARRVGDADLLLLDVRHDLKDPEEGPRRYAAGHLPGAVHAHVDRDLSSKPGKGTGRHPLPDVDAFVETCRAWGIDKDVQVVCYDDWGGAWASRAWWLLRHYGHAKVAVLDGGVQAWTAAGHSLSQETPTRERRQFFGHPGHMETVTTWDIMTRAPRCLVDARAPVRYRGDEEPIDPVGGHIPDARNAPFTENVDKDGRFLPVEELRARYERLLDGLEPKEAAFYCGSGVTAPHDILSMELAGLPGAALYPGSWSEWVQNKMRPVVKGGDP